MKQDYPESIIVFSFWLTQVWYLAMLKMLVSTSILENTACNTNTEPGTSSVKKDGHADGPFVRLFAEIKSLSKDALEILAASWRVRTGKR